MFWEKKRKNEGLPDLPPAPAMRVSLPPIKPATVEMEDSSESIPSMDIKKMPWMESGKSDDLPDVKTPLNLPKFKDDKANLIEVEEWRSEPIPEFPETSHINELSPSPKTNEKQASKHSIFVKIDKFKSARGSLTKVEEKLEEIDDLFKKLREVKMKEDKEVDYIEKELQGIKSRIRMVTEDIFDKSD